MARLSSKKDDTVTWIVAIVFGIILVAVGLFQAVKASGYIFKGETVDLYDSIMEDTYPEKGSYVSYEVYAVLGNYAETKHTINGIIPAGKEQHYAIILDDGSITTITVKSKKMIDQLDAMVDATWDYFNNDDAEYIDNDPIVFTGEIISLDHEISGFLDQSLREVGAEGYFDWNYYSIDATKTRGSVAGSTFGVALLGAVFAVAGFFFLRAKKKTDAYVGTTSGSASDAADSTYGSDTYSSDSYSSGSYSKNQNALGSYADQAGYSGTGASSEETSSQPVFGETNFDPSQGINFGGYTPANNDSTSGSSETPKNPFDV